ncbi:MAG: hypothetical protein ABW000_26095 [Actinoplanes sp.]
MTGIRARAHRLLLVGGLFLLAPLIGEYLFGNIAITELPFVFLLASLYGAGAVLIREVARRTGRGWPAMLLLALAYALFEEGPVDQMLWNPHYGGIEDFGLSYAGTYVPWLDTSVQLLQDVVSLHTVWSICVPIALVEAFDRNEPRPWLGRTGLITVASVFALGSLFLAATQIDADGFVASAAQYAGTSAVIVALVVAVFVVDRQPLLRIDATAPSPWLVGAIALVATAMVTARQYPPESVPAWLVVAGWFVLVAVVGALVLRWSRSRGWGDQQRLALAGGALLTYVGLGFQQAMYLDVSRATALFGKAVFGLGAVGLLILAARRQKHRPGQRQSDPGGRSDRPGPDGP